MIGVTILFTLTISYETNIWIVDSPSFIAMLLVIVFGTITICISLSYYIARARWRTMMDLRERHSPSRDPE
jgi:hypothetical protein